jgi:single-strand DNA-binding protein
MSYDTNSLTIIGRLTKDPEGGVTQSNKQYAKFSIAVNAGENNVNFFNCTAWDKTAQNIIQYVKKGTQIAISGSLKQDRWQDQQGNNKTAVSINAFSVQFLSKPQGQQQQQTGQPQQNNLDLSGQSMGNAPLPDHAAGIDGIPF